jgi:hypothetical protein
MKVLVQLNPKSQTTINLSVRLIEGVVIDTGMLDNPSDLEYLHMAFINEIRNTLYAAPLNHFLFSSLDDEGNINGAL